MKFETTHGYSRTKLYRHWAKMKRRCISNEPKLAPHYKDRGITVCDEWNIDFESFKDWSLSHGYEEGKSLDRINNDKGYSPDNCRWATRIEQANNRTDSHYITYNGETKTIADWARDLGISKNTIFTRLRNGWSEQDALSRPINKRYAGALLEYNGKSKSISAWAREINISPQALFSRLENGWSIERTLTTPSRKKRP